MTLADRAVADLALVIDYWPGLADTRLPDVRRPYREPTITAAARAELDHQARQERADRIDIAPGEHPDAVRVEVLDMMGDLVIAADDIATLVARAIQCPRLEPPPSAFTDPRPWLHFTARHLPDAARCEAVAGYVSREAQQMVGMLTVALGLAHDGQRLAVLCPWCRGAVFGGRTLRVRLLPGGMVGIVCEFELCSPPPGDVGTWWRGRPVWPLEMWPWLAKRIARATRPDPVRRTIGRREAYEAAGLPGVLAGCRRADKRAGDGWAAWEADPGVAR